MAKDLGGIDGIGPKTEESLNDNGINTIKDLASASIEEISNCGMSSSRAKDIKYKAKQNTVTYQNGVEVQEEYNNKNKIKSNIENLDEAIEGGFEEQSVVSIWGDTATGKSQLAQKLLVEGYEQTGKPSILIETEKDRFRPDRIRKLANKEDTLENIIRVKAYDTDTQYSSYDKMMEEFEEVSVVVIDSLTARIRLSTDLKGRQDLPKRSNIIKRHLNKIEEMSEYLDCPVVFTNQASVNPDSYGKNLVQYGGKLIQYTAQFHIQMSKAKGELFEAEVQAHPSTGDTSILIDISEEDVKGV
jgi:DNA repair protein RAD51/DNA repair protein RadA